MSQKRFLEILITLGVVFMPFIIFNEARTVVGSMKLLAVPLVIFLPLAVLSLKYKLFELTEFSKRYSKVIGYVLIAILAVIANKIPHLMKIYLVLVALFTICFGYYIQYIKKRGNETTLD